MHFCRNLQQYQAFSEHSRVCALDVVYRTHGCLEKVQRTEGRLCIFLNNTKPFSYKLDVSLDVLNRTTRLFRKINHTQGRLYCFSQ